MALAEMGFGLNGIGLNAYWPNWELDQLALELGRNGIGRNGFGRSGNSPTKIWYEIHDRTIQKKSDPNHLFGKKEENLCFLIYNMSVLNLIKGCLWCQTTWNNVSIFHKLLHASYLFNQLHRYIANITERCDKTNCCRGYLFQNK